MTKTRVIIILNIILVMCLTSITACNKQKPLKPGEMVYSQWFEGKGNGWEEAKILAVEGDEITIRWKDIFAKGADSVVSKHERLVLRRIPLEKRKAKVGSWVLIQRAGYLLLYQGEIVARDGDLYTVKFKSGSVEKEVQVGIQALWQFDFE